jgi:hypothetical protein
LPNGTDAPAPGGSTAGQALAAFYVRQGLPADGGSRARSWRIAWGPLAIPLPNFRWRSHAIPLHDLHHVLTGYPCTPAGEFEMAAWEFAAGRFPHAGATAFCLPLVGFGALLSPRRTFAAFVRGRHSRTLYAEGLSGALLDTPLDRLRTTVISEHVGRPSAHLFAFVALAGLSLAWSLWPLALLAGVLG